MNPFKKFHLPKFPSLPKFPKQGRTDKASAEGSGPAPVLTLRTAKDTIDRQCNVQVISSVVEKRDAPHADKAAGDRYQARKKVVIRAYPRRRHEGEVLAKLARLGIDQATASQLAQRNEDISLLRRVFCGRPPLIGLDSGQIDRGQVLDIGPDRLFDVVNSVFEFTDPKFKPLLLKALGLEDVCRSLRAIGFPSAIENHLNSLTPVKLRLVEKLLDLDDTALGQLAADDSDDTAYLAELSKAAQELATAMPGEGADVVWLKWDKLGDALEMRQSAVQKPAAMPATRLDVELFHKLKSFRIEESPARALATDPVKGATLRAVFCGSPPLVDPATQAAQQFDDENSKTVEEAIDLIYSEVTDLTQKGFLSLLLCADQAVDGLMNILAFDQDDANEFVLSFSSLDLRALVDLVHPEDGLIWVSPIDTTGMEPAYVQRLHEVAKKLEGAIADSRKRKRVSDACAELAFIELGLEVGRPELFTKLKSFGIDDSRARALAKDPVNGKALEAIFGGDPPLIGLEGIYLRTDFNDEDDDESSYHESIFSAIDSIYAGVTDLAVKQLLIMVLGGGKAIEGLTSEGLGFTDEEASEFVMSLSANDVRTLAALVDVNTGLIWRVSINDKNIDFEYAQELRRIATQLADAQKGRGNQSIIGRALSALERIFLKKALNEKLGVSGAQIRHLGLTVEDALGLLKHPDAARQLGTLFFGRAPLIKIDGVRDSPMGAKNTRPVAPQNDVSLQAFVATLSRLVADPKIRQSLLGLQEEMQPRSTASVSWMNSPVVPPGWPPSIAEEPESGEVTQDEVVQFIFNLGIFDMQAPSPTDFAKANLVALKRTFWGSNRLIDAKSGKMMPSAINAVKGMSSEELKVLEGVTSHLRKGTNHKYQTSIVDLNNAIRGQ